MKYCPKCGKEAQDGDRFCRNCGFDFDTIEKKDGKTEGTVTYEAKADRTSKPVKTATIEYRNIAVCIIRSIITGGIYGLYWQYRLTEDANEVFPDDYTTSGGMAVVFTLVTCGLYGFYWAYKMGKKVSRNDSTGSLIYVLLYLFVGIVCYALIQTELNQYAK